MRGIFVRLTIALPCISLAGCSAPLVGIDPAMPAIQRSQSQRDMPLPPLDPHPSYEVATATIDVPVPYPAFELWFAQTGMAGFTGFLAGTPRVPGVVRTEPLNGGWSSPGDRRRVVYADANSALEQILDVSPQGFRYEVWNLTNDTGRFVSYAVGDFSYSAAPSGTRVIWQTAFQPKAQPPDGWFIRRYVQIEFQQFMQAGLAAMLGAIPCSRVSRSSSTAAGGPPAPEAWPCSGNARRL